MFIDAVGAWLGRAIAAAQTAPLTTDKVRLRITQAPVCPAIAEVGLFLEP